MMKKKVEIINARLANYQGLQQIIVDEKGKIAAINPMIERQKLAEDWERLDLKKDWISLGGIDLQINGGLGLAFPDLESKHLPLLEKICQFLWQQGVDGFLPTIVTTSVEKIRRSLATISDFIKQQPQEKSAEILGVHLEGPFLNYSKRGAHPAEYLLPLNQENLEIILSDYQNIVKIITLAPELNPTGDIISYLNQLGIIISLGHSQATAEEAKKAFKLGASMVTHAFNAMPSLHHRQPGLLGEAIVSDNVYCGLIADGNHVSRIMMEILLKASNYEKGVFLVSDALAPIGLIDGIYPWDSRQIEVKNGTARLFDGTLSGTTLPLLVGVENLVNWGICSLEKAILLATEAPRKAINIPGIATGGKPNFLRWQINESSRKITWSRID